VGLEIVVGRGVQVGEGAGVGRVTVAVGVGGWAEVITEAPRTPKRTMTTSAPIVKLDRAFRFIC